MQQTQLRYDFSSIEGSTIHWEVTYIASSSQASRKYLYFWSVFPPELKVGKGPDETIVAGRHYRLGFPEDCPARVARIVVNLATESLRQNGRICHPPACDVRRRTAHFLILQQSAPPVTVGPLMEHLDLTRQILEHLLAHVDASELFGCPL